MIKITKQDGFASFVEIVVTAVIFVAASVGIFTTLSMMRPQGEEAMRRLEAAYVGKSVIDELRANVDASTWDLSPPTSGLAPNHYYCRTMTVGTRDYNVVYYLEDIASMGIRQLHLNVNFNP